MKKTLWNTKSAYLLILPSIILFLLFFLYPIIYSISLSLTNTNYFNFISGPRFIGFENYYKLIIEGEFFQPLLRTIYFVISSVMLKILVGLFFALLFSLPNLKFKEILHPLFILPWAVPWFFLVMIWRGMFNQDFGFINQVLNIFGIEGINWLNNRLNAFISINIVEVYLVYPFFMTVTLAAIKSIPVEIIEAAMMDGANSWNRFWRITVPMIKKTFLWATLMTTISSYMIFGVPYLLNKGGPGDANEFLLIFGYKKAFELGRYGYASAFMVIVLAILLIIVIIFNRITRLTHAE